MYTSNVQRPITHMHRTGRVIVSCSEIDVAPRPTFWMAYMHHPRTYYSSRLSSSSTVSMRGWPILSGLRTSNGESCTGCTSETEHRERESHRLREVQHTTIATAVVVEPRQPEIMIFNLYLESGPELHRLLLPRVLPPFAPHSAVLLIKEVGPKT